MTHVTSEQILFFDGYRFGKTTAARLVQALGRPLKPTPSPSSGQPRKSPGPCGPRLTGWTKTLGQVPASACRVSDSFKSELF
jgi:hypothetical protein